VRRRLQRYFAGPPACDISREIVLRLLSRLLCVLMASAL